MSLKRTIINIIRESRDTIVLIGKKKFKFESSKLKKLNLTDLSRVFSSKSNDNFWKKSLTNYKKTEMPPDLSGGVNPGDIRAIHYLITEFKPIRILEIGTHIGNSLISMALAASYCNNEFNITTVDIKDVNDQNIKPWTKSNSKYSPYELLKQFELEHKVTFKKSDSVSFLKSSTSKYDFIFLDGSHHADIIYDEIMYVSNLIEDDCIILLHDYFPDGKPIWNESSKISGPYLAFEKIKNNNQNDIDVLPLRNLPWKTKYNSNKTSLAILTLQT